MAVAYRYRSCNQSKRAHPQARSTAPRPRPHRCQPCRRGLIPIAPAAPSLLTSRGFFPWRLSDTGPGVCRTLRHGPASETLHKTHRSGDVERAADEPPIAAASGEAGKNTNNGGLFGETASPPAYAGKLGGSSDGRFPRPRRALRPISGLPGSLSSAWRPRLLAGRLQGSAHGSHFRLRGRWLCARGARVSLDCSSDSSTASGCRLIPL